MARPNDFGGTMKHGRTYAEYLGGTRVKYTHEKCGHSEIRDYSKGPVSQRCGEAGARFYASWHSREKGGCTAPCGICERAAKKDRDARIKAGESLDSSEMRQLTRHELQRYLTQRAARRRGAIR